MVTLFLILLLVVVLFLLNLLLGLLLGLVLLFSLRVLRADLFRTTAFPALFLFLNGLRGSEPRLPILARPENVGEEEVKESPELVEVVLQGRSGDEETELRVEETHNLK